LPWAQHITARHARWAQMLIHHLNQPTPANSTPPWVLAATNILQARSQPSPTNLLPPCNPNPEQPHLSPPLERMTTAQQQLEHAGRPCPMGHSRLRRLPRMSGNALPSVGTRFRGGATDIREMQHPGGVSAEGLRISAKCNIREESPRSLRGGFKDIREMQHPDLPPSLVRSSCCYIQTSWQTCTHSYMHVIFICNTYVIAIKG